MVIAPIRDVAAEHVVHALDGPSGDEATVEPFLGGAAQHCHHVGVKPALACGGPPDTHVDQFTRAAPEVGDPCRERRPGALVSLAEPVLADDDAW